MYIYSASTYTLRWFPTQSFATGSPYPPSHAAAHHGPLSSSALPTSAPGLWSQNLVIGWMGEEEDDANSWPLDRAARFAQDATKRRTADSGFSKQDPHPPPHVAPAPTVFEASSAPAPGGSHERWAGGQSGRRSSQHGEWWST